VKIRDGLFLASMLCGIVLVHAAHAQSNPPVAQTAPAEPQPSAPAPADNPPTQPAAAPSQATTDPAQTPDTEEPAGNVATLKGTATVTRNGMTGPLKIQDEIYKGDILQTGKNSTLGVTFSDDTTLNLSATSRVVVDNFVYQNGGKDNAALINVTRGTMAFVAAAVAKTGDMKIETPTATLGIRGTTGVVEVPENTDAAGTSANNVGVKLYPDADGKVGRIEVKARDGAPLGMLTQGASGFTVRGTMVSGFGMRMTATPMVMSAQVIARDRAFTQRVFAMQGIGRNIVMQQRNFRMQNPNRPPAFGRPGFNQRDGFNQRGGFNQPGLRGQPGLNNHAGQPNAPGKFNRPGINHPGSRQPGLQHQPGQRGSLQPNTGMPGRAGLPHQNGLPRTPGTPGQFGQRAGTPNQLGGRQQLAPGQNTLPRQTGMPGGFQRPSGMPSIPGVSGAAGGILNRLGVPNSARIPQAPGQQMPTASPRAGQRGLPGVQKRLPQGPKPEDPRNLR